MSTTNRQPLGLSLHANVRIENGTGNKVEHKLKKVQAAKNHEQRRRKYDVQGNLNDVELSSEIIDQLKRDLERAKDKISRRDETIRLLESRTGVNFETSKNGFERKLNELVERHHVSKNKYQAQIAKFETDNKSLQETISSQCQDILNLKTNQANLRKENQSLLKQLETSKQSQNQVDFNQMRREMRDHENERLEWKVQKHKLERHVQTLQSELEHSKMTISREKQKEQRGELKEDEMRTKIHSLEKECSDLRDYLKGYEELESENDRLESLLETSSINYRMLFRNTVSKDQYQKTQEKLIESQFEASSWKNQAELLQGELRSEKETTNDLREQLDISKEEIVMMDQTIRALLLDKKQLREEMTTFISSYSPPSEVKTLKPLPILPIISLLIDHNTSSTTYLKDQLNKLDEQYFRLLSKYQNTKSSLASTTSSLADMQRSFEELQNTHEALEESHQPCPDLISNLQLEVTALNSKIAEISLGLREAQGEAKKADRQAQSDRECLRRANEVVVRSKMAEEALDEEIRHLQEAYIESAKYEELYLDLKEQYELLESRELAAIEEAERLGLENAELAGHTNEYQKINYVEGVRREMVLIKQELASTRHLLNISNDKLINLENDIQAYKSIDAMPIQSQHNNHSTLNGSTRTRVMRRQPENGRLTVSRNGLGRSGAGGAGGGRSVSGPIGR